MNNRERRRNCHYFFEWTFEKQICKKLVNRTGGGFILMDSGGVPENVTVENFTKIKNLFETVRLEHRPIV